MNSVQSATLDASTGWLILAILSVLWLALGGYLGRRAVGLEGYMLAGRKVGLVGYFLIGFNVAALISAAVPMTIVLINTWLRPGEFDWAALANSSEKGS